MTNVRSLHRLVWLAAIVLLGSPTAHSQSPSARASITGSVQDQAGASIVGARVELSAENMRQQSTTTNQSGAFQFKRVPPGKYQVQVSFQGFEPATVDVIVGGQP